MGQSGECGETDLVRRQISERERETKTKTRIGFVDHLEHLWQQFADLGRVLFEDLDRLFAHA